MGDRIRNRWKCSQWQKRGIQTTVLLSGIAVVAFNGIAWMQARAMTHYVEGGERTGKPEELSLIEKARIIVTGVRLPRPINHQTPQAVGLSFETHQITLADGGRLEAWFVPAEGSRGVVLLFPPYGASKQALLAPSKIFHDLGYDTLLVDFRGVGGSSGSDTTLGVREEGCCPSGELCSTNMGRSSHPFVWCINGSRGSHAGDRA